MTSRQIANPRRTTMASLRARAEQAATQAAQGAPSSHRTESHDGTPGASREGRTDS